MSSSSLPHPPHAPLWPHIFAGLVASVFLLANAQANPENRPRDRPNFVFLLVDDLGWADLGCFGSSLHETPHIDALCNSGMKLTQAYAACPVCSPTRASILTGRHPVRVDITDWIPGSAVPKNAPLLSVKDRDNLALEEVTIAETLRAHGYRTFFAGKWHLGGDGHLPTDQGFDQNIGGCAKGQPPGGYYAPWKNPYLKATTEEEYLTERLTKESLAFIDQPSDAPFLLYLSYYNVHTPITPYRKRIEHFRKKQEQRNQLADGEPTKAAAPIVEHDAFSRPAQDNPSYASMVSAVDDSVGQILDKLKERGLDQNTVIIFFSDNGGLCTLGRPGPTCNLPLRAGKGWLYEGGIREPTIIRAPGVTRPGTQSDQLAISMDFYPTILELAGIPIPADRTIDGISLLPMLRGNALPERTLYWHYPHYHGSKWRPGAAIRDGDWKLIEFYDPPAIELYNMAADLGEQQDLSQSNSEKADELREKLHGWQRGLNAKMPSPNPNQ